VLQGYGSLLASLGQLPQAIATTRKAAERDPMVFSLWQALGYYEEGAGHFDEARVAQQRALAIRPDFPFVQYRLGMLELQQRQPKRALAIFEAIEFEPLRLLGQAMAQHDMRHASESQVALDALARPARHGLRMAGSRLRSARRRPGRSKVRPGLAQIAG
jgi:tetratricopeptide (TPR) repeat protein